jgi:hypothetical protein
MIDWKHNPDMVAYMTEIIPGHEEHEIRELFQKKFGITLTKTQIKNFKTTRGIKSGTFGGQFRKNNIPWNKGKKTRPETYKKMERTMFKKGNKPLNHREVGSERVNVDGYIEIKVAEPATWKLKQRVVYEEYHKVKLTSNDTIIFLDGNKLNLDINNLFLMKRDELVRYNQDRLHSDNQEQSRAAAQIAILKANINKKRKETDNDTVRDNK